MEHRWNSRRETSVPVLLCRSDGTIAGALVRNISAGGLLIDASHTRLDDGDVIGVVWTSQCPRDAELLVQKAVVVHVRGALIGVMFIGDEPVDVYSPEPIESRRDRVAFLQ